ncbi:WhiB family transcriptional regulator [Nocardia sp. NPDC052001]|uniref:WhiB family transcriptional regulator n=1 Tax=Nocardia sp. NPDC052001 TaxID=3154853 RepID=UPI003419C0DD
MNRIVFAANGSDPRREPDCRCRGVETDLFFPDSLDQAQAAQRVCLECPVLAMCAAWALREDLTDCVVASVWLPSLGATKPVKARCRAQLEQVAATGRAWFESEQEAA